MPEVTGREGRRYTALLRREVLEVTGPESGSYLQGQLSQDVLVLSPGRWAWSWVLSPQGKVDALVRVARLAEDRWLLDTDAGWGASLASRLDRFKLRTKAEITLLPWKVLALREEASPGRETGPIVETGSGVAALLPVSWPRMGGVDLIGPDPKPPEGWRQAEPGEYEADRIEAGVAVMGREIDERTIPAETGLVPLTVSFTKGCYTGQELVARVDARGSHVPRRLRRLLPAGPVPVGCPLTQPGGGAAGVLTSVARTPEGRWVALGYTRRGVEVPATLIAALEDGTGIEVQAEELTLW